MKTTNLITLVITLTIGIILAGSLLMPVVDNSTATTKTILNTGSEFVSADSDDTDTHTIIISMDADSKLTITTDGEAVVLPDFSLYGAASILYGENTFVRVSSAGVVNVYGRTNASTYGNQTIGTASAANPITISITGTTATISTYTIPDVQVFIAAEGPYVLTKNPYVLEDSMVFIGAVNTISGTGIAFDIYGPLDDLIGKGVWPNGRGIGDITPTLSNPTTNLYKVDKIEAEATNDGNVFGTMTITYFVAPKEITYDNAEYIGDQYAGILGAIPVLIIAALVVAAAGALYLKRDD